MELIRKENGNVELRDSGVLVWSMAQLPVEIKPIDKEERDHVKLFQNDGRVEYIYVDDLTETQIEPNAAVPFAGTVFDLADLLSADFFFEVISGGTADVIFQEQDATQDTTQSIYFIRHSFNGNLEAGTYQIDSYQYLEILGGGGEIRNGIFIDTVLTGDIRETYILNEPKPLLNRYIYIHGGGTVQIDSAFRRSAAATSATCTFSNLIIKKIG